MRTFPTMPPALDFRGVKDPRSTSAPVKTTNRKALLNDRRSTR
jgi:hypothetical protein